MIQNINLDKAQVSAELHGFMYDAIHGRSGVFDYDNKLAYELVSNNEIKLKDGLILNAGRFMRVVGTESIAIENGVSGSTRYDLIVAHFETDGINEVHDIRVIKGDTNGTLPTPTQENIYNGGTVYELPLYSVFINGLNVENISRLFVIIPSNGFAKESVKANLLKSVINGATTQDGIAIEESNGVYTLNGTATKNTYVHFNDNILIGEGRYKLVGCPSGGSDDSYFLYLNGLNAIDYGDGAIAELAEPTETKCILSIRSGQTLNNLVVKPMITNDLNATYDDYITFEKSFITGASLNQSKSNQSTITSGGSDYGECTTWSDSNPSAEDRLYRFVTIVGDNREIAIANSTSQIVGTTNIKENVGFLGNYTEGAESDSSKAIVSILGVSYVKTNDSSIVANDRVMSDDSGYAVKSSNNLGYRVLKVAEAGLLEIVVSPNTDMVQRIKTDIIQQSKASNIYCNDGNSVEYQVGHLYAITEDLRNNSGLTVDLLWTNTNLASDFTAQTIPLNLTEYKAIIVDVYDQKYNLENNVGTCRNIFIKKGLSEKYAGNGTNYTRTYTVNDSGVTISSTNYNHGGVPARIYGLK